MNASTFRTFLRGAIFSATVLTALPAAAAAKPGIDLDDPDTEISESQIADIAKGGPAADRVTGDFRSAFDAWKRMEGAGAATQSIALPSRKPLDGMSLSSAYGMRVHPVTGRLARHNGIDLPAPRGTPIYATADGVVGRAQRLGGYGNYVEIEHGSAIQTRYGHMSSYAVTSGQRVKQGDIIGYVGSTGRSTGNHLHYEVRIAGAPVNPLPFMQQGENMFAKRAVSGTVAMGGPE